ncbi:hypothetical protein J3Q64DRAFT_1709041 [Phycomyces blakesleeanus]|uniref:Uncharacterized protein n=2 Tax=Phycomyces blakesleeanus TaxID=4837 RepID=A0A162N3G2_PHYB8|nr:hypothetical protein PHYBLDRAFT_69212 [Phycomyces blakesleeanus NRRL 1555(-)]OAD68138.1 hypothetical protein PHYBLDRAFT_69212 [Phycomyces blakesleeanus NRRL 1555(-)]|eukprot:XP_018286178.1 hypothetical protein PHYBLDRAFT_69212 [Phycomyces blakesleeanus NRRL 1555(-)]
MDSILHKDVFTVSQSLEDELATKGFAKETPLVSSLATELDSAKSPIPDYSNTSSLPSRHHSTPSVSTLYDSGRIHLSPDEPVDAFEVLEQQLGDLSSAVWETKTLHKRLFNTLLSQSEEHKDGFAQSLELAISYVERGSRDRERQTSDLRTMALSIRKEGMQMSIKDIRDLEVLMSGVRATLHDQIYLYENPVPTLHTLDMDTMSVIESMEELKEHMYVNKKQAQELNSRLRLIGRMVHEVRKENRRTDKVLEAQDDEIIERDVHLRAKAIIQDLDDLDAQSTKDIKSMQVFWQDVASGL